MPHPTELSETVVFVEPTARRVRATFNGETVVDSQQAMLLFERGHVPHYYFPREDVRFDLLQPTDHSTHCPHKGDASYWTLRVADRVAQNAAWAYPDPIQGQQSLSNLVSFYWHEMDHWYEEDEEVYVHPRDPYRRVDTLLSSRHIEVILNGQIVADSRRPALLFETGLPTRYYLPVQDVRLDLLHKSPSVTQCPYKGIATTWTAEVHGQTFQDIAWSYPFPIPELPKIENLICFYNERVDQLLVDGELEQRPESKFSR
ncbi:MAG: DUF427 domain-containing protein [Dehalococcoidia bacterium]|jgi:uncharacterized protein (DUF427 family)|nr:DUF427 domain-containing protein [Dehalococcoidia bacterium]